MDKVRNTKIRSMTKVEEFSVKNKQNRLRWFGHVFRRDESYVGKRVLKGYILSSGFYIIKSTLTALKCRVGNFRII